MPHVNLLFPFLFPEQFERAAEQVSLALAKIEPFETIFDSVQHFQHGSSCVVWLHPAVCL
jgi:2'-5' RNA ligase